MKIFSILYLIIFIKLQKIFNFYREIIMIQRWNLQVINSELNKFQQINIIKSNNQIININIMDDLDIINID